MVTVCAWCTEKGKLTVLGSGPGRGMSHGICAPCLADWRREAGMDPAPPSGGPHIPSSICTGRYHVGRGKGTD
jgi:hypothetical protein